MKIRAASLALLFACSPVPGAEESGDGSNASQPASQEQQQLKTYSCMADKSSWGNCGYGSGHSSSYRQCVEVSSPDACPEYESNYDHSTGCGVGSRTEPIEISDLACDQLDWHGGWYSSVSDMDREYFSTVILSSHESVSVGVQGSIIVPREDGRGNQTRIFDGFNDLLGVWAASLDEVFVVGRDGILLKGNARLNDWGGWDIDDWDVRSVHGRSSDDVWAVGSGGAAYHFEGHQIRTWETGFQGDLNSVWVAPNGEVWAAGAEGVVVRFDGTEWSRVAIGAHANLRAVFGTSTTDIWVAGEQGTIVHFDGRSWTRLPDVSADITFTGVRALGAREVHFSSNDGLYRWNGFELRRRQYGDYNSIDGRILDEPGREGEMLLRAIGKDSCHWDARKQD